MEAEKKTADLPNDLRKVKSRPSWSTIFDPDPAGCHGSDLGKVPWIVLWRWLVCFVFVALLGVALCHGTNGFDQPSAARPWRVCTLPKPKLRLLRWLVCLFVFCQVWFVRLARVKGTKWVVQRDKRRFRELNPGFISGASAMRVYRSRTSWGIQIGRG